MSERILVVEDEDDLRQLLVYNLRQSGFEPIATGTGAEALVLAEARVPDLVLLDLMLPDMSGAEVCRELRRHPALGEVPIIIVSARSDEVDRVVGFELGADDYVVKPFSPRELMLRVRALLKRVARSTSRPSRSREVVRGGSIVLDASQHVVTVGGEEKRLTALEFKLLRAFMSRPGRVQSREELLDEVWGVDIEVTNRTVDTHVKRLREKLGAAGAHIETVRGVGYRFRAVDGAES